MTPSWLNCFRLLNPLYVEIEQSKTFLSTILAVPLEPLSPRIRNVTSRWIELTWQPPSNAESLGSDLLGYRVYVEELCDHTTTHRSLTSSPHGTKNCRSIPPETVHGPNLLMASFYNLGNTSLTCWIQNSIWISYQRLLSRLRIVWSAVEVVSLNCWNVKKKFNMDQSECF